MPVAAPKPCSQCGVLVRDGTARCELHRFRPGQFGDRERGSRQARGYGAAWERLRVSVLKRDCGLCQPCLREGRVSSAVEVDHVVNKAAWRAERGSLEGCDAPSNLQAICPACHRAKTADEARRGRPGRGGA